MLTITRGSSFACTALLVGGLLLSGCAGTRKSPENSGNARLKDSAPEKAAALRAANSDLNLEDEDARWGITAAQERKRARDEQKRAASNKSLQQFPPKATTPDPSKP